MAFAATSFGKNFLADQEAELDSDSGETYSLSSGFGAGSDVVITSQFAALHPGAIVYRGQRVLCRVAFEADLGCARVEGVGRDLGKNRFLERSRVCVPQVLEQMQQIDACFTHG